MEAGMAERANIALQHARQTGSKGEKAAGTAAEDPDPARKCAKSQIAARSAEKQDAMRYWY